MYRATYCARTSPLPLLPSGPGGFGGIAPRRTRHTNHHITECWPEMQVDSRRNRLIE